MAMHDAGGYWYNWSLFLLFFFSLSGMAVGGKKVGVLGRKPIKITRSVTTCVWVAVTWRCGRDHSLSLG